jgi:hypothetical protein
MAIFREITSQLLSDPFPLRVVIIEEGELLLPILIAVDHELLPGCEELRHLEVLPFKKEQCPTSGNLEATQVHLAFYRTIHYDLRSIDDRPVLLAEYPLGDKLPSGGIDRRHPVKPGETVPLDDHVRVSARRDVAISLHGLVAEESPLIVTEGGPIPHIRKACSPNKGFARTVGGHNEVEAAHGIGQVRNPGEPVIEHHRSGAWGMLDPQGNWMVEGSVEKNQIRLPSGRKAR